MPFIETPDGAEIYYREEGSGPPLLLIHGWSMSGKVWRFQAEELASSCRLIMPDLRGHGRSTTAGASLTMELFAGDISLILDRLDISGAVVAGWSIGAQAALQAYADIRARLAAIVLVGGAPKFTSSDDYHHGLPQTEARGLDIRLRRGYAAAMGEFFRGMFAEGELSHAQYQRIVKEIVIGGRQPELQAARESLAALVAADLRPVLPHIDLPALLIHGSLDAVCLPGASRYMAERIPKAELRIMEGMGHAPFMSHPTEFNRILLEFMEKIC